MPRVTMASIAARAGVSKNTVSLALRSDPQIPPATRQRIERIAHELGYQKNPVVAELMSELSKSRLSGFQRTLALLNAHQKRDAFTRHPTIPAYVEGCRRRAASLGYGLDEFWLHDPDLNGERLNRILRARGIRGALVVGLMAENILPPRFTPTWLEHACVVTGVRTQAPLLSFASCDHHALVLTAMEQVRRLNYQRPALVLDEHIDRLVEGRFSAGMWIAQQKLPARRRLPGFYEVTDDDADRQKFRRWLEKYQPDVVLTLYHKVRDWLEELGLKVPADIGLVQLECRPRGPHWAGMDQHNDLVGEAAVDMVVGQLLRHELGCPETPRATLIEASWRGGPTVRPRAS